MYDTAKTVKDEAARARRGRVMRHDLGSALLVVMAAAAVLFVTAAAVVGIVVFQQTQQARAQAVVRSTALAQQGMEVYLTALRTKPDFWVTTPTIAGTGQDGTWTVAANVASNTITAVGHDRSSGVLHVIRTEVRAESWSDYVVVTNDDVTLGNGAGDIKITGDVRSNGKITLAQDFPGLTAYYASTPVDGANHAANVERVAPLDFSRIDNVFPNLYTAASRRDPWATGASGPEASYLTKSLAFYRDPSNPARGYWGPSSKEASTSSVPGLVGVGIDFTNQSDAATGRFYIRSVWTPVVPSASATDKASVTEAQYTDFAAMDPVWNTGALGAQTIADHQALAATPGGLNPNGNNVVYVGGNMDVYVKGEFSRSVTIVSERNIYIIGSITRAATAPTATVGLVAKGNIYICGGEPAQNNKTAQYQARNGAVNGLSGKDYTRGSVDQKAYGEVLPNNVTITASLMAVDGAVIMDPEDLSSLPASLRPAKRNGTLTINGSVIARKGLSGPNFANSYDAQNGGFAKTVIGFDNQTKLTPPPLFPQIGAGALKVIRWDEYTTDVDPNAGLTFPPPGVYGPTGPVIDNGEQLVVVIPQGGDDIAPVTKDNVQPVYNGQAVITLDVSDASNNGGSSAIWKTWYKIGNDPTVYVGKTVEIPPLPDNTVATETVTYWSQDMAGNMEAPQTVTFQMRGNDTLPAFTTVVDSQNPAKALPDGYPQIGDPDYVVYGEFQPLFSAVDSTSGLGVEQLWVIRDGNVVNSVSGSTLDTLTMNVEPPATGFVDLKYQYYSIDKAGNREPTRYLTVKQHAFDKIAPLTYHDAPASGLYVGDAKIHLKAYDDVQGQGVKDMYYQVDGGAWVQSVNTTVSMSMVTTVTIPAPARGSDPVSHTIRFYSRDLATTYGRKPLPNSEADQTGIQSLTVLVGPPLADDITPPVTTSDAQPSYVGPATILLTSTDAGGVADIHWKLDGGATQTGTKIYVDSPWSGSALHTISFWAVDVSGNTETAHTATFTITPERTPPITSAHNFDLYAGPAVFQLTAEDNDGGSGLNGTYYSIDGGPYQLGVTSPLGLTWVTVTGDGLHHITFYSVDHANNVEAVKSTDLRIDTTAPTTSDDSTSTAYVGQALINLTAVDGGSGVAYTHWRNAADGVEQVSNPVLLGTGTWDIDYWSVDKAGNAELPKSFHVVVTAAPDVSAPESYDDVQPFYKSGQNPPAVINLYSWDVQSGVQTMYYNLDGVQQTFAGKGNPPAGYQLSLSGDGTHTIEYWASDKAGNIETPHHIKTFKIDTILPVTTCSARAGANYWATMTFTLQGTDAGSGIKGTYYTLDGGVTIKGTSVYVPAPTDGFARPHVIQFWSVDNAGNIELAKTVSFTSRPLDNIAPTTFSNATSAYKGTAIISLTAQDNLGGSGVAATHYRVDSGPDTTGTLIAVSGSGNHTLEFWSVDNAGNVELPHKNVTYNVDGLAPTTISDARSLYNSAAIIHLTASDNSDGSNVAATYYKVDNGAITSGTPPVTTVSIATTGTHTMIFWSVDGAGNIEATKTVTFKIDMTPPVTSSNAVSAYAGTADILLTAVDEVGGSGVSYTHYKIDGGADTKGTSFSINGPASGAPVGHTIQFWSEDAAGNVETAKTATFTVAPLAPMTFSGAYPTENSTITVRNPTVQLTGHATSSTLTTVTAKIDGKSVAVNVAWGGGYTVTAGHYEGSYDRYGYYYDDGCDTYWVDLTPGTPGGFWEHIDGYWVDDSYYVPVDYATMYVSFPVTGLLNGQHAVSFTFTNALAATNTKTWTFTVNAPADVTAPVTTSNAVALYAKAATVTLSAVDETGGTNVAATNYKIDGGSTISGTPPQTIVTVSSEGSHTIEFWSTDGAGNAELHKMSSFKIDMTPPTTYGGALASYAGTATVWIAAKDNAGGSGVKNTYFKLDSAAVATASTTPGLDIVGLWHLDESAGTALTDSSRFANTATITGGGTHTAGYFGNGLTLAAASLQAATTPNIAQYDVGGAMTIGCWFKTSTAQTGRFLVMHDESTYKYGLYITSNSTAVSAYIRTASGVTSAGYTLPSGGYNDGQWHYLAATYDKGATSSRLKVFVDGVQKGQSNGFAEDILAGTGGISIGRWGSAYFDGQIDEVSVSNMVHSPTEIQNYYNVASTTGVVPRQVTITAPVSGAPVPHTLLFWSDDIAGNVEGTKTASFSVSIQPDTTPPTTTSDAVASYVKPATISLTATDNLGGWGVAYTKYQLDTTSGAWTTGTAASTGTTAGSHTLYFFSADAAGNVETVKSSTFTLAVDNTPPVTTSNALSSYVGSATITLMPTDVGWGVDKTYYKVDGGVTQTGVSINVTAPVDLTPVSHTVQFWSTDLAGNKETTKSATYSVTGIPAGMTFTGVNPVENSVIKNVNPTITVTGKAGENITGASATLDGVAQAFTMTYGGGYWVDNGYWSYDWIEDECDTYQDWVWHPDMVWVASDATQGTVSFPAVGLSNGPHTVSVTYNLASGAQGRKTWTFIIDLVAPTTTSNAAASYTGTATVNFSATDNTGGSGVAWTKYRVDTGADTTGTQVVIAPPSYGSVSHTVYFWSGDNAGNVESPAKFATFTQSANPDTIPPTTTSNAATSYPQAGTITLTAVDNVNGWGVANTYYILDGGAITTGTAPTTAVGTGGGGTHTLLYWSVDRANNKETTHTATYTVTPDTTPPTSGSNTQPSYNGTASITVTATDNVGGWGVDHIDYKLDSAATQTVLGSSANLTIYPPALGAGAHTLVFMAVDKAGNREAPAHSVNTTVNAMPANIVWNGWVPGVGSANKGTAPTISVHGKASENISSATMTLNGVSKPVTLAYKQVTTTQQVLVSQGYYRYGYYYDDGCETYWVDLTPGDPNGFYEWVDTSYYTTTTTSTNDNTDATATVTTGGLADGTYNAQFIYTVASGAASSTSWTFWVDNVAPVTTSTVVPAYSSSAFITLSASDAVSGVASTWYSVDGGTYQQGTSISIGGPSSGAANHSISFYSIDRATNQETAKTATFTINATYDGTPPTTTDNVQRWYKTISTITLTPYDAGWGVSYTKYQLVKNGVPGVLTTYTAAFPTGDGEGNYILYYFTVDKAGNKEATRTAIFGVDMTPPVTSSNATSTYSTTANISLTATDNLSGVSTTLYKVDAGSYVSGTNISVAGPASGTATHTVSFYSTDVAGNQEAAKTATFSITAAPAAMVWSAWTPPKLSTVNVRNPSVSVRGKALVNVISATATLNGVAYTPTLTYPSTVYVVSGYDRFGWYVDDGCETVWEDLTPGDPNGFWEHIDTSYWATDNTDCVATFNTSNLADGVYTVVFNYTVTGGAQASETWTFTVAGPDNIAPTTTSNALASYAGTATISLTATDNVGGVGVKNTYFKVDGGATTSGTVITVAPPAFGSPVAHTIQFWSVDYNNNTETTKSASFNVGPASDLIAPTTTSNATSTYTGNASINLTATDNVGGQGVATMCYKIDTGSVQSNAVGFSATGGTSYTSGANTIVVFTASSNLVCSGSLNGATVLVVAGGGGGGGGSGAGGGGGGVISSTVNLSGTMPVTIGAGGAGGAGTAARGTNGANSVFAGLTAIGGGGGGANYISGLAGGSGGGGYPAGTNTAGQGFAGGADGTWSTPNYPSGGGGGAGAVGGAGVGTTIAGNGGIGLLSSITGTATYYAGGGGGGTYTGGTLGTGGLGGGGNGGGFSATANTGGGGGGGKDNQTVAAGSGGSGIVIISYPTPGAANTTVSVAAPTSGSAPHTLYFWSIDRAGNVEATKTATFTVNATPDNTAPVTTSNALTVYNGPSTITLTPVDNTGGWGLKYTHYILTTNGVAGPETTYTAPVATGSQGSYSLAFYSVDLANNRETTKTAAYVVDQTAPSTTSNAVTTYTVTANITLAASDTHVGSSGVRYTYYKVDAGSYTLYTGSPFSVSGPASGPPVSHTISFYSVDWANNTETAKTATFAVTASADTTAPTTTSNRVAFYAGPSTITLTPTDNVGGWGVATTWSRLDSATAVSGTTPSTGGAGQHSLQFWSVDNAGNVEAAKTVTFTVDMTPPTTTSNALASYTGTATITLTGADDAIGSGVKNTYYKVDGGTQTSGTVITVSPPVSFNATHTIQFWSVDNMNNAETAKSATFTITANADTWAPVTTPVYSTTYSRPGTITLNTTDIGWGVQQINYKLDNGTAIMGYYNPAGGVMSASCLVGTGNGGPHTLEYWAVDNASPNNTEIHHTINYTVTPDTTPPVTTSNAVAFYTGPATVSLTATDTGWGVKYTHYIVDNGAETSGTSITVPDTLTGTVSHTIYFWSVDNANNKETTNSATFSVKATPANMTFSGITPPDGSTVTTSNVMIRIQAACDQAITTATVTLDGGARTPIFTASGLNATATLNATGLTNGPHTVEVFFTGANGRQNSKAWGFTVAVQTDFTPPTTLSNAVSSYYGTATVALVATDNAGGSGVAYTKYKVDSGALTTGTLVVVGGPASGQASHTIYFWSVDNAGNVEATKTATFVISPKDVTAPTTVSNANPYYNSPGTILLTASDDQYGTGVAHTYFRLDGGLLTEGTMVGTGGAGLHVLEFYSIDVAGNIETTKQATYKVDVVAPNTTSDAVANYTGTATILLSASDNVGGSGIKNTYYIVDTGNQVAGTVITVAPPVSGSAQHTVYWWSVDNAGNVESTKTATFNVAAPPDTTPPTTTSDVKTTYAVPGLITLTAQDNVGGWGVGSTYYKLDNGAQTAGLTVRTGGAGSHTIEYWSVDKGGNTETHVIKSYTVTAADTTPPTTTSNAQASYVGSATISLTATDNCGVMPVTYYKVDSGDVATGTTVHVASPRSGSAAHTLYFWSVDLNGLVEATKTANFTVTTLPANMTFTGVSPVDGSTIVVRNPTITVTGTDSQVIGDVTFELDGAAKTPVVALAGNHATMTYPAVALASGTHTAVAVFTDVLGASSTLTWTFTVNPPADITAPVTTSDGVATYKGTAIIKLVANDEVGGSGVISTFYKIDGGSQFTGTVPTTTVTVTAAGPHTITFWSVDRSNNVESQKTLAFNVDVTPPTTNSDAQDSYTGNAVIHLTPTDNIGGSGIANTYYMVDGAAQQSGLTITIPAPATNSVWHHIDYWSVDNAGNVETTKSADLNVWAMSDSTPPATVSDAHATYTVPSVIHLTATDTGGWGVAHTYYRLDGGPWTEATIFGTGGTGSHTIQFYSVDLAGNSETIHSFSYTISGSDTIAPTTTSNAQTTYTGTGQISLTATDNVGGSGVAHTYYRYDGGTTTEATLIGVSGGGTHNIQFWSVDWAGNVETAKSATFTVNVADTTPPVTTSNALSSYIGTATITLTPTDPGSGVRTTFYRLDGGAVNQGTTVVVYPPASGAPVAHTIVFWSVDNIGNTEPEHTTSFTVARPADVTAPVTTSDGVLSYTGAATIHLTATDNVGGTGVVATYYRVDGGSAQNGTVIVIQPPASGAASHVITFWSVDAAGNTETAKTWSCTVNAVVATGNAYLSFIWEPSDWSEADLHVEAVGGAYIASNYVSGYDSDLDWTVTVPAGKQYYMACDNYYSDDGSSGGGYGTWTTVLGNNENYVWYY